MDDDYYDVDGMKFCDGFGNSILVNDGNKIYDLETGQEFYEKKKEEIKIIENPYVTFCVKILYFIISIIGRLCEIFFYKSKNREI